MQIQFSIIDIKTLRFSVNNVYNIKELESSEVGFSITPMSFFNPDEKIIGFDILVLAKEGKSKETICELFTRVSFFVDNFDEFFPDKESKTINIPDQFLHTLLSISLSTTRGILSAKTEGTALAGFILPVLNPKAFSVDKQVNPGNKA